MRTRFLPLAAILGWLFSTLGVFAATPPPKENFHVYLLMGQSNMAGRDTRTLDQQVDDPAILTLAPDGVWIVARDPIHPQQGRTVPGAGPGIPFAREMRRTDPTVTIGLVPCAVGGTSLKRWVKGADLYEQALARAKLAAATGTLKGVLWHQGESDTSDQKNADAHEARLAQMLADLRRDLATRDLPIVVGQIGDFLSKEKYPFADTVRAAIARVPTLVPRTAFVDSAGLGHKGDELHFSAEAQTELGTRYARAMRDLQKNLPAPRAPVRIAKFRGDRAAAISYTFDDGIRDQFTLAVPMLDEVGFKGTFFVIPGSVSATVEDAERRKNDKRAWGTITWDELRTMSASGHEIASHTWSHRGLLKLSAAEVDTEFTRAAEEIRKQIGRPALTLAFPFNQSTPEIEAAALKHHVAFRGYQTGVGGERTTVASLNTWADQQIRDGAWGVIMAHAIGSGYAAFTDPEILRAHLRTVKTRDADLWVDTFAAIARYVKERDAAKLTITDHAPGRVTVQLDSSLDPTIYDVPLTVVLDIPGARSARAERAGRELPVRVSATSIQIDALPGAEPISLTWR